MRRCSINHHEVVLDKRHIHRLRRSTSNDQILLDCKALLYCFGLVSTADSILIWDEDLAILEVVPAKELFGPELEAVEQMKVGSVGQRELVLAVSDKALYSLVIVVVFRVCDEGIDAIHLT